MRPASPRHPARLPSDPARLPPGDWWARVVALAWRWPRAGGWPWAAEGDPRGVLSAPESPSGALPCDEAGPKRDLAAPAAAAALGDDDRADRHQGRGQQGPGGDRQGDGAGVGVHRTGTWDRYQVRRGRGGRVRRQYRGGTACTGLIIPSPVCAPVRLVLRVATIRRTTWAAGTSPAGRPRVPGPLPRTRTPSRSGSPVVRRVEPAGVVAGDIHTGRGHRDRGAAHVEAAQLPVLVYRVDRKHAGVARRENGPCRCPGCRCRPLATTTTLRCRANSTAERRAG